VVACDFQVVLGHTTGLDASESYKLKECTDIGSKLSVAWVCLSLQMIQKAAMSSDDHVPNSVALIDDHLDDFFDDEDIVVFHEIKSEVVHSDVYFIKPSEDRDFNLLLSCGMSALPMNVPSDLDYLKYAEVFIILPKDWKLKEEDFQDENNYWPVRTLKQLSKYPHLNDTWFGYGHTIPFDQSKEVDHNFHSLILLESIKLSEDFTILETEDGETVYFYSVVPLYKEEVEFKMEHGTGALLKRFTRFEIDEVVDIHRPNTCVD
jgi:hypothetical protein